MVRLPFVGRKAELAILEQAHDSPFSELCVIYGRRRIGRTRLLEEFASLRPSFFYQAGRETKQLQLRRFVKELGENLGESLLGQTRISTWDEALTLLDRAIPAFSHEAMKAVVVFDEFQWMCRGAEELVSDLQRFWDKRWRDRGDVLLILCGSSISFMLGDVLSRRSPLFGRRTRSLRLESLNLGDTALLLPGRSRREVAEGYMTMGRVPTWRCGVSSSDG